jgi:predicted component of type VI protein secretion system
LSGDRSKRAIESALSIALASHIGEVGVRIREFTGAMVSLSEYQKTRLGTFSARLGETFIAGDSISMPSSGAHVIVGPTNRRLQHHFVPGASVHRTLVAVARHLISPTITLTGELRLVNEDAGAILGVSRLSDDFILPTSGEEHSLETSIALDLNPSGEPGALS